MSDTEASPLSDFASAARDIAVIDGRGDGAEDVELLHSNLHSTVMGFKRARSTPIATPPSSPGSSAPSDSPKSSTSKRKRESAQRSLADIPIYIVSAKLDSNSIRELIGIAEDAGATVSPTPEGAEVLVTSIGMRRRLERHLDWALAVRIAHLLLS